MKLKTIILTLILVIGFTFQNCNLFEDDCNCPPFLGDYFDIQGIELINYKKRGDCCADRIADNQEINFLEYHGLTIDYIVEYLSSNCKRMNEWNLSIMNSAYACSCLENGWEGSKNEKLNSLTITTINDFDNEHLANDTINDLFEVRFHNQIIDLNEYLAQDTSLIMFEDFGLILKKAPELTEDFQVKVKMELSTNEIYEAESNPIKIKK